MAFTTCTVYVCVSFTSFRMWVCDWEIKRERKFVHGCKYAYMSVWERQRENVDVVCCILVGTACIHVRNCVCLYLCIVYWVAYTSYHFATSWHRSWQHLWGIFREVYHLWMFLFDTLYLMKAVYCNIMFCFCFACIYFRL